jgi:pimeloyl-ACP methyl ester carboxylesterase
MEEIKEQTFNTGDVTINFAEVPSSGPPLMMLHGGGDRWQHFLPMIPPLARRWHVYAVDLRGHGKSGRVPGKYRPEHYVADIVAFIDGQVLEDLILFGHSLGGWITLLAAAERERMIRGIILGDPPLNVEGFLEIEGSEDRISMWRKLRALAGSDLSIHELAMELACIPVSLTGHDPPMQYGDLPGVDEAHLRAWAETLSRVDPDVAQYHAEGRLDEYVRQVDLDTAMRQMACPVLLLQADPACGGMNSDQDVKHALSLLSEGSHVKLEGVGHDLGLESGEVRLLQTLVTNYLETLR